MMNEKLKKAVERNLHFGETLYEAFPISYGYFPRRSGNTLKYFFVSGTLKGEKVTANLSVQKRGGYAAMELVFRGADKVYLVKCEEGTRGSQFNAYKVRYKAVSFDKDGEMTECYVTPRQNSDASILNNLLTREDRRLRAIAEEQVRDVEMKEAQAIADELVDEEEEVIPEDKGTFVSVEG